MAVKWVNKSDGRTERFSLKKIARSIYFAQKHIGITNKSQARHLAQEAAHYLQDKKKEVITSLNIRDAILYVLRQNQLKEIADSYELMSLHLPEIKIKGVEKRNGNKEAFHPHKLFKSLRRASSDCGISGAKIMEDITKEIVRRLEKQYPDQYLPTDAIKKTAASLLKASGFEGIEHAYVMHRYV